MVRLKTVERGKQLTGLSCWRYKRPPKAEGEKEARMAGHMYWAVLGSDSKGISYNGFYFLGELENQIIGGQWRRTHDKSLEGMENICNGHFGKWQWDLTRKMVKDYQLVQRAQSEIKGHGSSITLSRAFVWFPVSFSGAGEAAKTSLVGINSKLREEGQGNKKFKD